MSLFLAESDHRPTRTHCCPKMLARARASCVGRMGSTECRLTVMVRMRSIRVPDQTFAVTCAAARSEGILRLRLLRENCRLPENWTDSARPALGQQVVAYNQRRIADFPRMMIYLLA